MATAACSRCGKTEDVDEEDGTPMGWAIEFDRGRVLRYCVECCRENVRAIEGKLSEEYW